MALVRRRVTAGWEWPHSHRPGHRYPPGQAPRDSTLEWQYQGQTGRTAPAAGSETPQPTALTGMKASSVTPERSCPPGAQASQGSALWPAGLASAARLDCRTLAQALTMAAVKSDWPAEISQHMRRGSSGCFPELNCRRAWRL